MAKTIKTKGGVMFVWKEKFIYQVVIAILVFVCYASYENRIANKAQGDKNPTVEIEEVKVPPNPDLKETRAFNLDFKGRIFKSADDKVVVFKNYDTVPVVIEIHSHKDREDKKLLSARAVMPGSTLNISEIYPGLTRYNLRLRVYEYEEYDTGSKLLGLCSFCLDEV